MSVDDETFRRGSKFYSIFGQIEEVVAEAMVAEGKARKIPAEQVPDEAAWSKDWQGKDIKAKFAIFMPVQRVPEFEERIRQLRA